jgi:multidrug efflux pump subunit AcrA (membrane-fusion protein)
MTAELKIQTTQKQSTLSLPIEAILHDLDNAAYVYVADTSKQKAYKRIVSLGKIIGNNIEITSGLSLGEKVVVSGTQKIANGTSIIIK